MWHGFEEMGWGWIGLGVAHMLLFWGVLIALLVVLVKWLAGGTSAWDDTRAIDILKARYAKGELTREQFEQLKRELAD